MEAHFERDFSDVRVYTHSKAAESAESLDAMAYTVGSNILFGAGRYSPGSRSGDHLLAHELAHVAQQSGRGAANSDESFLEREAETAASRVTGGGSVGNLSKAAEGGVQRRETDGTSAQGRQPTPRNPPPIEYREGNARFHAALNRAEVCKLEVTLRVKLSFLDRPFPWTDRGRDRWRTDFMRAVRNRWSFKHLIVPSSECSGESCRAVPVRVSVVEDPSNFHYAVQVVGSQVGEARVETLASGQRQAVLGIDSNEQQQHFDFQQSQSEHEAGHMLGVPHIHCASNAPACYGVSQTDRADVMGEGSVVSPRDYEVFAAVMRRLSPDCDWTVQGNLPEGLGESGLGAFLGAVGGALLGGLLGFLVGGPVGAGIGLMAGALVGAGAGLLIGHYAR
jgi:hypothetical protein